MNSLLKRQIKKYLDGVPDGQLNDFLEAIDNSYKNYDEQIEMMQRAMKISSDELYQANQKLRREANQLKEINEDFNSIFESMNVEIKKYADLKDFDSAAYLREQSQKIITINKQREELLVSLEVQNKSLNEYAHVVSHDLKAPLRSIDSVLNWYLEDHAKSIDDAGRDQLQLVLSNVEKMDLLIQGILEYSSIDKQQEEKRLIKIDQVVDEIVRNIHCPTPIEISQSGSMPEINANPHRIKQIFQNLIQNAVKYNDKSQGTVHIACEEEKETWLFKIQDNGIGIDSKYFEKIFTIFNKLQNKDSSSGIGLSIVKKIVESYDGKIWLESELGKGTTFYFTIPKKHGKTK